MKVSIERIAGGEEEIIIRCKEITEEILALRYSLENRESRIEGIMTDGSGQVKLLELESIYYFESVDGVVFTYLEEGVCRIRESLQEILSCYEAEGVFRCSRTMVVNIYKMEQLKSEPGGKILATLSNGERIMISRKYAGELRKRLKRRREKR